MDNVDIPNRVFPPTPETVAKLFAAARERNHRSIHGSTRINDLDRVRELLDEGADVNALDVHGETALVWAARYGRTEILQILIEWGADLSPENPHTAIALDGAATCGHAETVRALLNAGVDAAARVPAGPHAPTTRSGESATAEVCEIGSTPLHQAVRFRHTEVVRVLLEHGADVNAVDGDGRTPWQLASRARKHAEMRELLKAAGAPAT
jgi:ankyrin repeat protein